MYMNTLQDAKILQGVFLCSDIYVRPQGRLPCGVDFLCRDYLSLSWDFFLCFGWEFCLPSSWSCLSLLRTLCLSGGLCCFSAGFCPFLTACSHSARSWLYCITIRTASSMANSITSTTTKRSKRKTVLTMKSTACRERRKYLTDTRKYPLSAWDLTEHTSHRVRLVLWRGRQKRSWKDLKISIFICWDTHSPAICSPMVQHQRMCRNCSDTLT